MASASESAAAAAAPGGGSGGGEAASAPTERGGELPLYDTGILGVSLTFGPCEVTIKAHDTEPARLVAQFMGADPPALPQVWAALEGAGIAEGEAPDMGALEPFMLRNRLTECEAKLLRHAVSTRLGAREDVEVGMSELEHGPTLEQAGGAGAALGGPLPQVTVSLLTAEQRRAYETADADPNTNFYVPLLNGSEDVVLKVVEAEGGGAFTVDAWGRNPADPRMRHGWHTASALDLWYRTKHLGTWDGIREVWVGRHRERRAGVQPPMTAEGGEWGVGNNVLVRFADDAEGRHCYAVMGVIGTRFKTDEPIVEFGSVVGNSCVPYPVAFTAGLGITMMDGFETRPRADVEARIAAEPCAHDDCWHHISGSGTRLDPALTETLWDEFR